MLDLVVRKKTSRLKWLIVTLLSVLESVGILHTFKMETHYRA